MANINEVIEQLKAKGYEVTETSTFKGNGYSIKGENRNISIVIYNDFFDFYDSVDVAVTEIEKNIAESPQNVDAEKWFKLENLKAGVIKSSTLTDEYISRKTKFEGISEFLYIDIPDEDLKNGNIKLLYVHEKMFDVTIDKLFEAAEKNSFIDLVHRRIMGVMDVYTNSEGEYGSINILNPDLENTIKNDLGFKSAIIIPSSVHEFIVMENNDSTSLDDLTEMIRQVNESEVAPHEQLGDKPIILY